MEKLLLAEKEIELGRVLARLLDCSSLQLLEVRSGKETLELAAREKPLLVVMDMVLADGSGLETLRQLREADPKLPVIMTAEHGTTQAAIEAMKLGAYDYLPKGIEDIKWPAIIETALQAARAMRQVVSYQPLLSKEEHEQGIIGKAAPMQKVFKLIGQAAPTNATVLLTGESGTGKELVARAIYHHSKRAAQPFLAVNCAAIPDSLLESELFGHEKGAFTGALARHIGRFEQCHNGTIFLDEIGDMAPATQAKILRVLQEGSFERVGGRETVKADVRIIAATNKDVEALVGAGKFREDLYYRLNVVRIHLPPLRERKSDIPLLTEYFLEKMRREDHMTVKRISSTALKRLIEHSWPGNVRELENVLLRAAVVARTDTVLESDLPPEWLGGTVPADDLRSAESFADEISAAVATLYRAARKNPKWKVMAAVEREIIVRALEETRGNQVQAAHLLGITRATLRKRIAKFGIQRQLQVH